MNKITFGQDGTSEHEFFAAGLVMHAIMIEVSYFLHSVNFTQTAPTATRAHIFHRARAVPRLRPRGFRHVFVLLVQIGGGGRGGAE